jgi:hypothetical protein
MTLLNAVFIYAFCLDGRKIAEIYKANNTFCWKYNDIISSGIPTLKDANFQCLLWLKEHTKVDVGKIKISSEWSVEDKLMPNINNYKENFKKKKVPAIYLTIPKLRRDSKWRSQNG